MISLEFKNLRNLFAEFNSDLTTLHAPARKIRKIKLAERGGFEPHFTA
jgi:hypothetical protein